MNHFKNKMSAMPAKNRMSAVEGSLQENKMCVVEDSLQEIKISAVEGDNSPNYSASAPHQNHPRHPKPKLKTEIVFRFQSMFTPSKGERPAGKKTTPMRTNMIENKRSNPCSSKARAINLYLV